MAISKETQEWLDGLEKEGGISGEALASIRGAISDSSDRYIRESALRQSDYSRNIQAARQKQAEADEMQAMLREKDIALTEYRDQLINWQTGAEGNWRSALAAKEEAEAAAAAAAARLKTYAAQLGVSEEEALKGLNSMPANTPPPSGIDTSNFVTKENLQQTAREAALIEGILGDLADEHQALGLGRLNRKELVQGAIKAGTSVEQHWRDVYKVDAKREELKNSEIQARIDAAVKAKEAEILSSIPGSIGPRATREDSPLTSHKIFSNKALMESQDRSGGGSSSGVSAAIAAFNSGKYDVGARR